ncbi:hypothetical protein DACRYDRAFT_101806 [Dacryopinax primogenitus]|uniref:Uncharacterized protein n=1 Tax=Dacryopinax primogenitus (strain DJM 731) TaxID=1858805 RepID=M5G4W7_DACPD|nr:uncharacterized protein DACRYDRAFT_101806 [Dacryopinax primogenitus]EJT98797.1 hypothetical protein DACRYDRAFT_101806 [Dacryopinax primogenitus]
MSYIPPHNVTPSNDAIYAALFYARVGNLHATTVQLHNTILANHLSWNVSADRVLQIAHSSPELAPFPALSPTHSAPFQQRSFQMLFYVLTYYEQCFTAQLSADNAARWHPMRYEICLMAAGVKPCCLVWLGPGYHSSNRAQHLQDRRLAESWVTNVWQRTVQKLQVVSHSDPALLDWLASVQTVPISAGIATGHPQNSSNWHSFTGRILVYSIHAPPHHRALVRWAFLQPNLVPGAIAVTRSPPSESVTLVPELIIAAALGYPCTRPATRGLDNLRTACFFYEDFADGRAVVTGFLAALPRDLSLVMRHLREMQRVLGPIVPGALNLGVRFEPNGEDQGEANAIHLQRLLTTTGEPLYTPIRPGNIGTSGPLVVVALILGLMSNNVIEKKWPARDVSPSRLIKNGQGLDRSQRAACRYLHTAGISRDIIERLFCKGPRVIVRAINHKTTYGQAKDDSADDELHVPEAFRRTPYESFASYEHRMDIMAKSAQQNARITRSAWRIANAQAAAAARARTVNGMKRSPGTTLNTSFDCASPAPGPVRSGTYSTPHQSELRCVESGLNPYDEDRCVSCGRPPRQAAVRATRLLRQHIAAVEERTVVSPVSDSNDQTALPTPSSVSPAQLKREDEDGACISSPRAEILQGPEFVSGSNTAFNVHSSGVSPYVSPPLSPVSNEPQRPIQDWAQLPSASSGLRPPWSTGRPCPASKNRRYAEHFPKEMHHHISTAAPASAHTTNDGSILPPRTFHDWLRAIRLEHRLVLLNSVGFLTLEDAIDAANFSHDTMTTMLNTLEEKGMTKLETWRLHDGFQKLK